MAKNGKANGSDKVPLKYKVIEDLLSGELPYEKSILEYLRFLSSGRKPNKKGGKVKSKYSKGGGVRTAKYKV